MSVILSLKDSDGDRLQMHDLSETHHDGRVAVHVKSHTTFNDHEGIVHLVPEQITVLREALARFEKPTVKADPTLNVGRNAERVKDYQEGFHAGARYRADRIAEGLPVLTDDQRQQGMQFGNFDMPRLTVEPEPTYPATRAEAAKLAAALVGKPDADNVIRLAKWLMDEGRPLPL